MRAGGAVAAEATLRFSSDPPDVDWGRSLITSPRYRGKGERSQGDNERCLPLPGALDLVGAVANSLELVPVLDSPTHIGIMLLLRLAMIQTEPVMTRKTISTPKARARILLVLSDPLPRCRKKTR